MDAQRSAELVLLLDALQKQLGHLQTECEATKAHLNALRAQYAQKAQTPPPQHTA
ncbi:hypothetical protein NHP190012_11750 [Helicobacter sp. NHP19-012]|uniref:Uncharacterized protein n=1 Tax=Helicobacter gastrofelis TaxID=2849642 RepID=A0ABN6I7E4_9HELI|nr:hypothetical protein [Helicobacter sp. NHP19-012]BCZ19533.1 hypothetical protein NHP190012_11750 [Helicobacter sp. NHP19-012]